jgi:hypothetical protein
VNFNFEFLLVRFQHAFPLLKRGGAEPVLRDGLKALGNSAPAEFHAKRTKDKRQFRESCHIVRSPDRQS